MRINLVGTLPILRAGLPIPSARRPIPSARRPIPPAGLPIPSAGRPIPSSRRPVVSIWRVLAGVAWMLPALWIGHAAAQIPGENVLPGRGVNVADWPGENVWPGREVPTSDITDPAKSALPGENQWPGTSRMPTAQAASDTQLTEPPVPQQEPRPLADPGVEQADLLPLGRHPDEQPWLRFNLAGHTAPIRSLAFSPDGQRLFSAGEDKAVAVWSRPTAVDAEATAWRHERTIRWQIQRGPRGRIYSLAADSQGLAMGGHGAFGESGEILVVDPASGRLVRVLNDPQLAHSQVVVALTWSGPAADAGNPPHHSNGSRQSNAASRLKPTDPGVGETIDAARSDARWLASVDADGRLVQWSRQPESGLWRSRVLVTDDATNHGQEIAADLQSMRRFIPLGSPNATTVIAPKYTGRLDLADRPQPAFLWALEQIDVATGQRVEWSGPRPHYDMVTALALSPAGDRMVTADAWGQVFLWDLSGGQPRATVWQQAGATVAAAFAPDGRRFVLGLAASTARDERAAVQVWELPATGGPKLLEEIVTDADVWAVAIHPQDDLFAYGDGNQVVLRSLNRPTEIVESLTAPISPPLRVAFHPEGPPYRLAFGSSVAQDGRVPLTHSFDTSALQLGPSPANDPQWSVPDPDPIWQLETRQTVDGPQYGLTKAGQWVAQVPWNAAHDGTPTAVAWLRDDHGDVAAVVIGTDVQNNIYVFRWDEDRELKLARQFRGHQSAVTALDVSADRRLLVSGSLDGTMAIWKLEGFDRLPWSVNRWGVQLDPTPQGLEVTAIRPEGPLHYRGVRVGDEIRQLRWHDGQQIHTAETPEQMLQALQQLSWRTMVLFETRRGRRQQPLFQLYPAWQPMASLAVAQNRQWAYWTPEGYYAASFDGHKLFGWQINRGLDVLPEFMLAAQLREDLERPEVMSDLLAAGDLLESFRRQGVEPPAQPEQALVSRYRLQPQVEILSPAPGDEPTGSRWQIVADVTLRRGQRLASPKAFANGVAAGPPTLITTESTVQGIRQRYQWDLGIPNDRTILLQVLASTESGIGAEARRLYHRASVEQRRPGRLYVLGVGVNQYQDAQIQQLEFARENARQVVETLKRQAEPLYRVTALQLLDDQATRWLWNEVRQRTWERARAEVGPDDLIVIFLSGHGLRDPVTDQYFFVTANARYADLRRRQYLDCLSVDDLLAFGQLPCRKLVILDTCHSGALEEPGTQELRAAIRALQGDLVLTLTASEGAEEAAEVRERRLGRFTARLLEALHGQADQVAHGGDGDGLVGWDEIVAYVQQSVIADSQGDAVPQHPVAGPAELLPHLQFPLTRAANSD